MSAYRDFSDERNNGWCIHCGTSLAATVTNRDHVPSRGLLRAPYPQDLPTVPVCADCNHSFTKDEEHLAALIGSVLAGSTRPDADRYPVANRVLNGNRKLRSRIAKVQFLEVDFWGDARVVTYPELGRVLNVAIKNARGHVFYEYGEPIIGPPASAWVGPLSALATEEKRPFDHGAVGAVSHSPPIGSRHLQRVATGEPVAGGWLVIQPGIYRLMLEEESVSVRTVMHEYSATEIAWAN